MIIYQSQLLGLIMITKLVKSSVNFGMITTFGTKRVTLQALAKTAQLFLLILNQPNSLALSVKDGMIL
jgi:hypothetical protein